MPCFILQNVLLKVHVVIYRRFLRIVLFLAWSFPFFAWFQLFFFLYFWLRLGWYNSLLCFAFIILCRNYLSEIIVLDAESGQLGHVVGCWQVLHILQAMRAVEVSQLHVQSYGAVIHLLQEVLGVVGMIVKLIRLHLFCCFLVVFLHIEPFTEVLSQSKGSIVSWRQHQSIQELIDCQNISWFKICSGPPNVWANIWYHHLSLKRVQLPFLT